MAIKFSINRKKTFEHEDDGNKLTFDFEFPIGEEINYAELRAVMEGKSGETKIIDKNTGKEITIDQSTMNAIYYTLRTSLKNCTGIVDENEKPYIITKEDGTVDEAVQKGIFEYVRNQESLYIAIVTAYGALNGKN